MTSRCPLPKTRCISLAAFILVMESYAPLPFLTIRSAIQLDSGLPISFSRIDKSRRDDCSVNRDNPKDYRAVGTDDEEAIGYRHRVLSVAVFLQHPCGFEFSLYFTSTIILVMELILLKSFFIRTYGTEVRSVYDCYGASVPTGRPKDEILPTGF